MEQKPVVTDELEEATEVDEDEDEDEDELRKILIQQTKYVVCLTNVSGCQERKDKWNCALELLC